MLLDEDISSSTAVCIPRLQVDLSRTTPPVARELERRQLSRQQLAADPEGPAADRGSWSQLNYSGTKSPALCLLHARRARPVPEGDLVESLTELPSSRWVAFQWLRPRALRMTTPACCAIKAVIDSNARGETAEASSTRDPLCQPPARSVASVREARMRGCCCGNRTRLANNCS